VNAIEGAGLHLTAGKREILFHTIRIRMGLGDCCRWISRSKAENDGRIVSRDDQLETGGCFG
jgi:hypothetical protein